MLKFATRRFGLALLILFVAVTVMFLMIRAVPGDPVQIMLGPRATPELQAQLTAALALDQPIWKQLVIFYRNLARGDLGIDVFSGRSVTDIVFQQLPYTLELIFASILWSATLGIALGAYAAAHPRILSRSLIWSGLGLGNFDQGSVMTRAARRTQKLSCLVQVSTTSKRSGMAVKRREPAEQA